MPTLSVSTKSLVTKTKPHPPTVGAAPNILQQSGRPELVAAGDALLNVQDSLTALHSALRNNSTVVDKIAVVDTATGKVIAALGDFIFAGVPTTNYFSEIHVGDPLNTGDPSQALFVAANGKVTIGQNGWLDVLDPYGADAAWIGTQFDTQAITGAADNGSGLIRITIVGHTLATGDAVRVLNVGGVPNATGIRTVTKINADHFDLQSTVFVGAYTSGGTVDRLLHVTGAANNGAGLIRLTVASHGFESGDKANVQTVGGVPNATGQWIVTAITANTFDLVGSTFAGAFTSGGTVLRYFAGGLFQTVAVGPSFANYKLRAFADGSLKISGATISLSGSGGTILMDPTQGDIVVTELGGGAQIILQGGTVTLRVVDASGAQILTDSSSSIEPGRYSAFAVGLVTEGLSEVISVSGCTGATQYGPLLGLHQSRGAPTAETATQSGDTIGGMVMWGYDGTGESQYCGGVRAVAAENHALTAHGAKLIFEVTKAGATTPYTAATLDDGGRFLIDSGVSPSVAQVEARANGAGALALLVQAVDNARLLFDCDSVAGTITAQHGAVAQLLKNASHLRFYGSTGNVAGSAATLTLRADLDLSNGNFGFGGNSTPSYAVDATGDVNASGVFRKGGAAGESVTLTYLTGTPGVGQSSKTVTFSGGIETSHT